MQLRGKGSMTGRSLLVTTFDNNVTKNGNTQYLDVQLDARDELAAGQTNLHATTRTQEDGRKNNAAPYSMEQFEAIKAAAGDKHVTLPNGAHVYGIQADLMPRTRESGLIINTKKDMGPTTLDFDEKVMDNHYAIVKENVEAKKAAEKQAPQAEAAAPEVEAEAEQEGIEV